MPTDWFYDSEQRIIGYVGLVNIGILTMVSIYKTVEFRYRSVLGKAAFTKKLIFHILLILTTLTDLPMYVEFIIANKYSLVSYSFHKLETAFLFTALSITIADWGHVLYDIKEYQLYPFLLRRVTLISINFVYILISSTMFVLCYVSDDLNRYLGSTVYFCSVFFQLGASLFLTIFMLSAGLRLSWRIHEVSMDYCALSRPLHPNDADLQKKYTAEFRRTVWTLNRVMASCAACIALQATMLILNYATGAYLSVSSTGSIPTLLYYACYLWVPLWGIVLSLTFLSGARKKRSGSEAERTSDSSHTNLDDSTEDAALIISNAVREGMNPLIGGDDSWDEWETELDEDEYTVTCGHPHANDGSVVSSGSVTVKSLQSGTVASQQVYSILPSMPLTSGVNGIHNTNETVSGRQSYEYSQKSFSLRNKSDGSGNNEVVGSHGDHPSYDNVDVSNLSRTLETLLSSSFLPSMRSLSSNGGGGDGSRKISDNGNTPTPNTNTGIPTLSPSSTGSPGYQWGTGTGAGAGTSTSGRGTTGRYAELGGEERPIREEREERPIREEREERHIREEREERHIREEREERHIREETKQEEEWSKHSVSSIPFRASDLTVDSYSRSCSLSRGYVEEDGRG